MLGDRDSAIRTRRRLVELYDATPGFPADRATGVLLSLGKLQRLAGRPDDAVRSLREALAPLRADESRIEGGPGPGGPRPAPVRYAGRPKRGGPARARPEDPGEARGERRLPQTWPTPTRRWQTSTRRKDGRGRPWASTRRPAAIYEYFVGRSDAYFRAELARALNNLGLARAASGKRRRACETSSEAKRFANGSCRTSP